jgi:hypothetical protein
VSKRTTRERDRKRTRRLIKRNVAARMGTSAAERLECLEAWRKTGVISDEEFAHLVKV